MVAVNFDLDKELRKAIEHHQAGRFSDADAMYSVILGMSPNCADALHLSGLVAFQMGNPNRAVELISKAIAVNPLPAAYYSSLGIAFRAQGDLDSAISCYRKALSIKPDYAEAYNNLGRSLFAKGDPYEAIDCYRHAVSLAPDYADAHLNEAVARLIVGDFAQGWEKYEWRFQASERINCNAHASDGVVPLWDGTTPIAGKTILLRAEQGFGDTLQFCRYVKSLSTLGATVLLEVQPTLKILLSSLAGVEQVFAQGDVLPAYDLYCPLLSVPFALKTDIHTIPGPTKYLSVDIDRVHAWKTRIGDANRPRIGIVWSGHPMHSNDKNRSIPLSEFIGVVSDGAQFVSLQQTVREAEQSFLASRQVVQFDAGLHDFSDTAALIELMDLVITVDTSIAHLAGALGKPVWILLPFMPDWRWLLKRKDSPWYPSMQLFRQSRIGDWSDVLASVANELKITELFTRS